MADTPAPRTSDGLSLPLRASDVLARGPVAFAVTPDPAARARLADDLGVERLRKLSFSGTLAADGRHDLRLDARLGATAVQACVVTGAPVTTRIDVTVVRRFLRQMPEPKGPESEIPDDDTLEPLGQTVDPGAVMTEALALELPDYPRAPGAALPDLAADDTDPSESARPNPFAVLARIKDRDGDD